jgi:predicted PurR-regulated permease PerM
MSEVKQVFHENRPLFTFLIGLVVCIIAVIFLWQPLLPFFIGCLIAYIFLPLIDWIDRKMPFFKKKGHQWQRIVIILVVFLAVMAVIIVVVYFTFASMSSALASLPSAIAAGVDGIGKWFDSLVKTLSPDQQQPVFDIVQKIGNSLGTWLEQSLTTGIPMIISSFTFILGFFTLPFFLIFFMTSVHEMKNDFRVAFPDEITYHVVNFFKIMGNIFGNYFRAQLVTALVIAVVTGATLEIMGIGLAPALGLIAGIFQLIPTIGGFIAAIIGIVVTMAVAPSKLLLVAIAYLVINLVVSSVITARLSGHAVNMRAALVMVLIVIGGYMSGVVGMILIVPVVAMIIALYKYARQEMEKCRIDREIRLPRGDSLGT